MSISLFYSYFLLQFVRTFYSIYTSNRNMLNLAISEHNPVTVLAYFNLRYVRRNERSCTIEKWFGQYMTRFENNRTKIELLPGPSETHDSSVRSVQWMAIMAGAVPIGMRNIVPYKGSNETRYARCTTLRTAFVTRSTSRHRYAEPILTSSRRVDRLYEPNRQNLLLRRSKNERLMINSNS